MTTALIIAAVAAVAIALTVFGIWFANYRGRMEGSSDLRVKIAKRAQQDAEKISEVLVQPRTDDDTAERLRNARF